MNPNPNKFFSIIFLLVITGFAQNLDSLMNSSAEQVRQYNMVPLIPPEKLFAIDDSVIVPTPRVTHSLSLSSIASQARMAEIEKRVREMEISLTKVTVILENMQKINEKHSDKFSAYMRFFEVIITAIAGIITALIGVYVKGRKK